MFTGPNKNNPKISVWTIPGGLVSRTRFPYNKMLTHTQIALFDFHKWPGNTTVCIRLYVYKSYQGRKNKQPGQSVDFWISHSIFICSGNIDLMLTTRSAIFQYFSPRCPRMDSQTRYYYDIVTNCTPHYTGTHQSIPSWHYSIQRTNFTWNLIKFF